MLGTRQQAQLRHQNHNRYHVGMLSKAAVRVVRDVREWLSDRAECDDPDVGWLVCADATLCLELLLEARENWLNSPDPTLWKTGDAHRLLIDTVAPRLTDIQVCASMGLLCCGHWSTSWTTPIGSTRPACAPLPCAKNWTGPRRNTP
jgi:hypothetical protein